MTQPGGSHSDWHVRLRRILETYFDESELHTLCFDLRFDYEQLAGEGKSAKVVELIRAFSRMGRIAELIDYCGEARPNIQWHELREAAIRDPFVVDSLPDELGTRPAPTTAAAPTAASAPATAPGHAIAHAPEARTQTTAGREESPVPIPSGQDALQTSRSPATQPVRRRLLWVWAGAAIGVVLLAIVGWCGLTDARCPWEEPYTYGDDPALDILWDECEAGDHAACTRLYKASAPNSEYEYFGGSCGWTAGDNACSGEATIDVPVPIDPPDGAVFPGSPGPVELRWRDVDMMNFSAFALEVDCLGCCVEGKWCTDVKAPYQPLIYPLYDTTYTLDWDSTRPGRWRVWAVDQDNVDHPPSAWSEFRFDG